MSDESKSAAAVPLRDPLTDVIIKLRMLAEGCRSGHPERSEENRKIDEARASGIALACDAIEHHLRVAAPAPRRREGQWQPIETAPQEAKQILVYLKGTAGLGIYRAYWNAAIGEWLASSYDHCDMFPPGSTLTHWMPLPDPPQGEPPLLRRGGRQEEEEQKHEEVSRVDQSTCAPTTGTTAEIATSDVPSLLRRTIRLAKEATNGWAVYAKRKAEHDNIAHLHREIAAIERDATTKGDATGHAVDADAQ